MKRYMITSALILLILASLGTFYAYGAELRLPEYKLQTLEGDLAEASKLTLLGSYVGGKGSYPIEVSTSGSKRSEQTFSNQWMKNKGPLHDQTFSEFKALYKEHPGFMRGKMGTDGYYSDQDTLIFAKASYTHSKDTDQEGTIRWSIDSLDLATGKQVRYTDELTDSVQYTNVIDVQKAGSEIHVLTNVNRVNSGNELIDMVFNAETGLPIHSVQVPLGKPSRNDRELQIQIIAEKKPTAANSRVLFLVTESSKRTDNTVSASDTIPTIFSERLFEYQYASGDVKELPLVAGAEEENRPGSWTLHSLERATYTTMHLSEEAVTINRYDLSTGFAHPQVTIKASQLGKGTISQAQVADGRIYLLLQTGDYFKNNSMPIIAVADITDGRILYQGTPAPVKANGRPDDQLDDAQFLNMTIMQ
ncbi:hypothetical protein HQN87_21225 [Paenibacillus tritici]|uniref:Uncharacterized protein n=1 Tax=Paenibacillus tritici TaxID=1873425 RepID=A0ABX2DT65_9BACL|nr:hypothetical protein [Paenibacillus tritici]NQX47850.1 hypothetical protein [Paenibacillus tritici]